MKNLNYKNIFIDLTVRSMLNAENEQLYINNLSIATVEKMLTGVDDELVECFWTAFERAHTWVVLENVYYEESIQEELNDLKLGCPECNCMHYQSGVACPNCEYVEC